MTIRISVAFAATACLAFAAGACQQSSTNKAGTASANSAEQGAASNEGPAAAPMTDEQRAAYMQRHGVGFSATDTNSDGRITMEEANAYARGPLTSGGDSDRDGAMSAAELAAANPAVRAQLLRRDTNGDGAVSSAEIDARVQTVFQATDTNHDGAISEQEFQAATAGAAAR